MGGGKTFAGWAGAGAAAVLLCLTAGAAGQGVTIELQGEIPVVCRVNPDQAFLDLGDLTLGGAKQVSLTLRCNAGFLFAVQAQFGALTNSATPVASPGFLRAIPYEITAAIATDAGGIGGNCVSSSLTATPPNCSFSSGMGLALQGISRLTVSWEQPALPLHAGRFNDTLVLSLTPLL